MTGFSSMRGQADVPHLIQFLKDEFVKYLEKGGKGPAETQTAQLFWEFAAEYLEKNRTVENWPADANIGVRLSNNMRMLLHPATAEGTGQMQDSGAVGVTEGQTQSGQEGVIDGQGKRVI